MVELKIYGNRLWRSVIGILISIFFLYLLFRKIDIFRLLEILKSVNYHFIILGVVIYTSGFFLKGYRWFVLIRYHFPNIKSKAIYPPFFIGFAANNFLPLRLGEFIRASLLARNGKLSLGYSVFSVFIDRALDGFSLLILFIISVFYLPLPSWLNRMFIIVLCIFGGIIFIAYLIWWFEKFSIESLLNSNNRIIRFIDTLISQLRASLKFFDSVGKTLTIIGLSVTVWVIEAFALLLFSFAFHFNLNLPEVFLLLSILNFGIMIPSSPGYVGTFEYFCVQSLQLFGILHEQSMAYAILLHFSQFIIMTMLGVIFINIQGTSWRKLRGESTAEFGKSKSETDHSLILNGDP